MNRYILNADSINDKGLIVDTDGIDLSEFESNPVMLRSHNPEKILGRWKNLKRENKILTAEPEYNLDNPDAVLAMRECDKDLSTGVSIGIKFSPDDVEMVDGIGVIKKSKLFEASITPIPANGICRKYVVNGNELKFENVLELCLSLGIVKPEKEEIKEEPKQFLISNTLELETKYKLELSQKDVEILNLKSQLINLSTDQNELKNDYSKLQLETTQLKKERLSEQIVSFLNEARRLGQITLEEKSGFASLAQKDFNSVKKIINAKPKKNPNNLSEILKFDQSRNTWTYHDWRDNDMEGLERMREQDPNRYYKLYNSI